MKNRILTSATAVILACAILLASGCGNTTTNSNVAPNQNAAAANANVKVAQDAQEVELTDSACNENNIDQKLDKVKAAIARKIAAKPKLQAQIDRGLLKYSIQIGPGTPGVTLDMYVGGRVGGKDNFIDLIKIIGSFVKASCTNRVVFGDLEGVSSGPNAAAKPSATPGLRDIDFEWFACEEPKIPCPGGLCQEVCGIPIATPTPDANSNVNRNAVTKP